MKFGNCLATQKKSIGNVEELVKTINNEVSQVMESTNLSEQQFNLTLEHISHAITEFNNISITAKRLQNKSHEFKNAL